MVCPKRQKHYTPRCPGFQTLLKGKHILPKIYSMGITILVLRPSVQYWRSSRGFGNGTSEESPEDVANIKSECMGDMLVPYHANSFANQPEKLVSFLLLLLMCMLHKLGYFAALWTAWSYSAALWTAWSYWCSLLYNSIANNGGWVYLGGQESAQGSSLSTHSRTLCTCLYAHHEQTCTSLQRHYHSSTIKAKSYVCFFHLIFTNRWRIK